MKSLSIDYRDFNIDFYNNIIDVVDHVIVNDMSIILDSEFVSIYMSIEDSHNEFWEDISL